MFWLIRSHLNLYGIYTPTHSKFNPRSPPFQPHQLLHQFSCSATFSLLLPSGPLLPVSAFWFTFRPATSYAVVSHCNHLHPPRCCTGPSDCGLQISNFTANSSSGNLSLSLGCKIPLLEWERSEDPQCSFLHQTRHSLAISTKASLLQFSRDGAGGAISTPPLGPQPLTGFSTPQL